MAEKQKRERAIRRPLSDDPNTVRIEGAPDPETGTNSWLVEEFALPPEEEKAFRLGEGARLYETDQEMALAIYGDVLRPWLREQGIEVEEPPERKRIADAIRAKKRK